MARKREIGILGARCTGVPYHLIIYSLLSIPLQAPNSTHPSFLLSRTLFSPHPRCPPPPYSVVSSDISTKLVCNTLIYNIMLNYVKVHLFFKLCASDNEHLCICPLLHTWTSKQISASVTNGCIKSSRRQEPNILHFTISPPVPVAGANWFLAFSEEDDIEMTRRSFDF